MKRFTFSFCTRLIDSMPAPMAIGAPSLMMYFAAVATPIRPDEHCRSMVMPATVLGRPARSAAWRAMLLPVVPCCRAQPMAMSSTSPGSIPAWATAAAMACPPRVAP